MNKKQLTEQEIRTRYITPAIQGAGWKPGQIREEVHVAGRCCAIHGAAAHDYIAERAGCADQSEQML